MASLTVVVKGGAFLTDLVKNDKGHASLMSIINHLESCRSGNTKGTLYCGYSSTDPVYASNTVAITYASVANNDTVTVAGTVLTCVTGTPSGAQFQKVTDGPTTAANLAAAINANTTLNKFVRATASSSTVTITCNVPGTIGNTLTLATSNGTGFVVGGATFSGGTGGCEMTPVSYTAG